AVLAALGGHLGGIAVLPVHGRAGTPAIRVVVRARKGSRAPLALLPGLNLNDEAGRPTAEAEAVLRGAEALPLTSGRSTAGTMECAGHKMTPSGSTSSK